MMNGKRMIRAGALSLALALVTVPAEGQAQEAVVGIKGGIDSYNLSWSPDSIAPTIGHKTGFVGGLFGGVTFTKVAGVQLEVLYSQRNIVDQDDDVDLKSAHFEIPLLFTAKFPVEGTPMRPIVFAWPSVSFESKCEVSGEELGTQVTFTVGPGAVAGHRGRDPRVPRAASWLRRGGGRGGAMDVENE
jgi:hypothetical protein